MPLEATAGVDGEFCSIFPTVIKGQCVKELDLIHLSFVTVQINYLKGY